MQVLYEVVPTVESSLRLRLIPALLVFVASHVSIIGVHLATKRARLEEGGLRVAADPSRPKSVYRVLVTDPFVLRLERSGAESAEEGQVFLRLASTVQSIEFGTIIIWRILPSHTSATTSSIATKGRDVASAATGRHCVCRWCCAFG